MVQISESSLNLLQDVVDRIAADVEACRHKVFCMFDVVVGICSWCRGSNRHVLHMVCGVAQLLGRRSVAGGP